MKTSITNFLQDLREYLEDKSDITENGYPNEAMKLKQQLDQLEPQIEAAPEMVEALRMAFPYIHDLQKDNFDEPGAGIFLDRDLETAFSKIQLSIAKATGKKEVQV